MNCQIVLCKNINDGDHLKKTLDDLCAMYPAVNSVSVVPCGLSDHRDGLFALEPFSKDDSKKIIDFINEYQKKNLQKHGSRIVFLADEFYLNANESLPGFDSYEDFAQLENGVGMMASFEDEFMHGLESLNDVSLPKMRHVSVATGKAAFGFICGLCKRTEEKVKNLKIDVYEIENTVFGKNITVAGLLCGKDIVSQLCGKGLGSELIISKSMLRSGEDVLLDDMRVCDIENALSVKVVANENSGDAFLNALLGICEKKSHCAQNSYEQREI